MKAPLSRVPLLLPVTGLATGIILGYLLPNVIYLTIALVVIASIAVAVRRHVVALVAMSMCIGAADMIVVSPPGRAESLLNPRVERGYSAVVDNVAEHDAVQSVSCILESADGRPLGYRLKVMVSYLSLIPQVMVGDTISFRGELLPVRSGLDVPDEIDYGAWLARSGYFGRLIVTPDDGMDVKTGGGIMAIADRCRHWARMSICEMPLDMATQEFLVAVLTGDDEVLSDDTRESLSRAGVAHILALSGLHVGIIIMILSMMLYPMTWLMLHKWRMVVMIVALWVFAVVTGLSTSVVRAVLMATFVIVGRLAGRHHSPLNSLLAAGLVILLVTPRALFSIGFQMSFAAVASILLLYQPLSVPLHRYGAVVNAMGSYILATVASMLSAGVISMLYFHSFPLYPILGNVVASVTLPFLLGWGVLALIVSGVAGNVPGWMCVPADLCYGCMEWIVRGVGELPGAVVGDVYPTPWIVLPAAVVVGLAAAGLWRRRIFYLYATVVVVLTGFALVTAMKPRYPEQEYFITRSSWHTTIVARDADSLYLITTAPLSRHSDLLQDASLRYNDYRGKRGLRHFSIAPQRVGGQWFTRDGALMDFGDTRLALIADDEQLPDSTAGVDIMLVTAGFTGDILALYERVRPGKLILSADINGRRSRRYEAECLNAGVGVTRLRRGDR